MSQALTAINKARAALNKPPLQTIPTTDYEHDSPVAAALDCSVGPECIMVVCKNHQAELISKKWRTKAVRTIAITNNTSLYTIKMPKSLIKLHLGEAP